MKWLKIAAAVVAAIIVIPVGILLAIGLRPDAGRLKVVSEIHKRPSQVWPWLREGDRLKLWVGWLKEVRETNPAGNKQIWVMEDKNNGGALMNIQGIRIAEEFPRHMVLEVSCTDSFSGTETFDLVDLGDGRTRLSIDATYRYDHWLARILEPLISKAAHEKRVADLARLRQMAESETAALAH